MLPNNNLSELDVFSPFMLPDRPSNLVDYEWGGVGLNDPSMGLQVQIWTLYYEDGEIKIVSDNTPPITLISSSNISDVSLSFDQNMRPTIAYNEGGLVKLRWFDSSIGSMVTTTYAGENKNPRLSLDDPRKNQTENSDIIFSYIRSENLYMRVQRDRFSTEYLLKSGNVKNLIQTGMTKGLRFQFKYQKIDEGVL